MKSLAGAFGWLAGAGAASIGALPLIPFLFWSIILMALGPRQPKTRAKPPATPAPPARAASSIDADKVVELFDRAGIDLHGYEDWIADGGMAAPVTPRAPRQRPATASNGRQLWISKDPNAMSFVHVGDAITMNIQNRADPIDISSIGSPYQGLGAGPSHVEIEMSVHHSHYDEMGVSVGDVFAIRVDEPNLSITGKVRLMMMQTSMEIQRDIAELTLYATESLQFSAKP